MCVGVCACVADLHSGVTPWEYTCAANAKHRVSAVWRVHAHHACKYQPRESWQYMMLKDVAGGSCASASAARKQHAYRHERSETNWYVEMERESGHLPAKLAVLVHMVMGHEALCGGCWHFQRGTTTTKGDYHRVLVTNHGPRVALQDG